MEKMETMPDKIELENWMTNLPYYLRKLPLIYLAIPGKHYECSKQNMKVFLSCITFIFIIVQFLTNRFLFILLFFFLFLS